MALEHLTDKQGKDVEKFLKDDNLIQPIIAEPEQRMIDEPECPHCHSGLNNRHGQAGSMQRYHCSTSTLNEVIINSLAQCAPFRNRVNCHYCHRPEITLRYYLWSFLVSLELQRSF